MDQMLKMCYEILHQDFECELVTPGDVTNYDKIQVFASGFCPVALVTGQGFVLPGNFN